jgi:peptidoglycan/LPS O-acetylase OafA/YrhL
LLWPLLLGRTGSRNIVRVCIGMLIVSSVARALAVALDLAHPAIWTSTFTRLDPMAVGALVAIVLRGRAPALRPVPRLLLLLLGASLLPLAVLMFGLGDTYFLGGTNGLLGRWGPMVMYPMATAGCALILLAILHERPSLRLLRSGPLVYLGRISYGLYVYHTLGIRLASRMLHAVGHNSILLQVVASLGVTILFAALSYQILERPFLLLKERFTRVLSRPDFRDRVDGAPGAEVPLAGVPEMVR